MAKHWSVRTFQKVCEQLPTAVRKNLQKDLDEVANNTTNAVWFAAPAGDDGKLRQSVRFHTGKHELSRVIRAGGPLTTNSTGVTGGLASFARGITGKLSYDYALAIEFGTQYQPAQPFFFPTIRRRRDGDIRKMKKGIKETLEYYGFKS